MTTTTTTTSLKEAPLPRRRFGGLGNKLFPSGDE